MKKRTATTADAIAIVAGCRGIAMKKRGVMSADVSRELSTTVGLRTTEHGSTMP